MKRLALALMLLSACTHASEYEGARAPAPVQQLAIAVHNNSGMPIDVYTSRGSDRHRLSLTGTSEDLVKLNKFNVDDLGCLHVLVHYVGGGDWTSPSLCILRGAIFDLTVSEQPTFNVLIVTSAKNP